MNHALYEERNHSALIFTGLHILFTGCITMEQLKTWIQIFRMGVMRHTVGGELLSTKFHLITHVLKKKKLGKV